MSSDQNTKLYIAKSKQNMRERISVGLQRTREHDRTPLQARREAALGRIAAAQGSRKQQEATPMERTRTAPRREKPTLTRRALAVSAIIASGVAVPLMVEARENRLELERKYYINTEHVQTMPEEERRAQYDELRPSEVNNNLWDLASAYAREHEGVSHTYLYDSLLAQNNGDAHLDGNEVFFTPVHPVRKQD